jgi:type II secretory pathway pseudopilin PulG
LIFEVAVVLLAVLWVGTVSLFLSYQKSQRQQATEQAAGDALRDQRLRELAKRLDDYQNLNVRLGDALHELRAVVGPLPEKLAQLEQRDPGSLSFVQAGKLVAMGASVDELTQACGLTQAEAELMSKLHRG